MNQPRSLKSALPYVILLILLFASFQSYRYVQEVFLNEERDHFNERATGIAALLRDHMDNYEMVLRGAKGLFSVNDQITRTQWKQFIDAQRVLQDYPGIFGVGFAKYFKADQLLLIEEQMRAEGLVDFSVVPKEPREEYTSIIYLEPLNPRNQRALGYDMFTEPVRNKAMTLARDNDQVWMSSGVRLKQEDDNDPLAQKGFLLYAPIYKNGFAINSLEQRRENLVGYVYMPFRMGDFIRHTIGKMTERMRVQIYDGNEISGDGLLFDNKVLNDQHASVFTKKLSLTIQNHQWLLCVSERIIVKNAWVPQLILLVGFILSFLVFRVLMDFKMLQQKAESIAAQMTKVLNERSAQLTQANILLQEQRKAVEGAQKKVTGVLDNAMDGVILLNDKGEITDWNKKAEQIFEYTFDQIKNQVFRDVLLAPVSRSNFEINKIGAGINRETYSMITRSGQTLIVEASFSSVHLGEGFIYSCFCRDITESKKEQELDQQRAATLERMNRLMVDRELRMSELKKQLQVLKNQQKTLG